MFIGFAAGSQNRKTKVGFLTEKENLQNDSESLAAFKFLKSDKYFEVKLITFDQIKIHPDILRNIDVLWFHKSDTTV